MNKKILIGSVIAVAVLVGVSFTSVVGYTSVQPDVKASPLFTVRTKRAIEKESNVLTGDYVGKGEECAISIPKRDGESAKIYKIINKIANIYYESNGLEIQNLNYELLQIGNNSEETQIYKDFLTNGWTSDDRPICFLLFGLFIFAYVTVVFCPIVFVHLVNSVFHGTIDTCNLYCLVTSSCTGNILKNWH